MGTVPLVAVTPLTLSSGGTISHNTSGVSAGTYGSGTAVPVVTVNATGHVTAISTAAVTGGGAALTVSGGGGTVTSTTSIIVSGGTVSGSGGTATITISAGGGVGDVGARVRRGSNFSHSSSGNDIAVEFTVEEYDVGGCADLGTSPTRLTAPEAGKYAIGAHVCFAANATGVRYIFLQVNGGTRIAQESRESASGTWPTHIGINTEWELAANDYVELYAYQDSGGALDIVRASSYTPAFFMRRVA